MKLTPETALVGTKVRWTAKNNENSQREGKITEARNDFSNVTSGYVKIQWNDGGIGIFYWDIPNVEPDAARLEIIE
jgi:hypothetical protein